MVLGAYGLRHLQRAFWLDQRNDRTGTRSPCAALIEQLGVLSVHLNKHFGHPFITFEFAQEPCTLVEHLQVLVVAYDEVSSSPTFHLMDDLYPAIVEAGVLISPISIGNSNKTFTDPPDLESTDDSFVNPYTGLWVHPESPNAPGPSGTRSPPTPDRQSTWNQRSDLLPKDHARKGGSQTAAMYHTAAPAFDAFDAFDACEAIRSLGFKDDLQFDMLTFGHETPGGPITPSVLTEHGTGHMPTSSGKPQGHQDDENTVEAPQSLLPDNSDLIHNSLPASNSIMIDSSAPQYSSNIYDLNADDLVDHTITLRDRSLIEEMQQAYEEFHNLFEDESNATALSGRVTDNPNLAAELVGDVPLDLMELFDVRDDLELQALRDAFQQQDQQELTSSLAQAQALQDELRRQDREELESNLARAREIEEEIHRRDQEEQELDLARARAIQDEWNRRDGEALRQEQEWAQRLVEQESQKDMAETLKEMRRWQEEMQAEENRRIEADRRFAMSLSEEDHEQSPPSPYTENIFARPVSSIAPEACGRAESRQPLASPAASSRLFRGATPAPTGPGEADELEHSFRQAQRLEARLQSEWQAENVRNAQAAGVVQAKTDDFEAKQMKAQRQAQADWQAEVDKNDATARAVQRQIENLQAQAQRDRELIRREQDRLRQEEERRRQEEAEKARKARKARMVDCNVCGDELDRDSTYRFPCKHAYCRDCLTQSIEHDLGQKKVFRCCKSRGDLAAMSRFLSASLLGRYTALVQELDTPHPVYCSRPDCSAFIPPPNVKAGTARCPKCGAGTCQYCKAAVHAGICQQDEAGQALRSLGKSKNWKECPHCGVTVERSSGCLHMTCKCGRDFCYSCGPGTCKR